MEILMKADHPFLCGINYVFQTQLRLYFIMPFIDGGELYKIFKNYRRFTESQAKFYAAQMIIGIGKLHEKGIVHRDLKLENIMLDANGYIKIIDFGLAKILATDEVAMTQCGTSEYFAPEVLKQCGYDKMVDYWAVGILIYEMTFGVTPFFSRNKHELMLNIQKKPLEFPTHLVCSEEVKDLITRLLNRIPFNRLGSRNGPEEVLNHSWFEGLDVQGLENMELCAPILPGGDEKYFNIKGKG